jgi:hypothetical protein
MSDTPIEKLMPGKWRENYAYTTDEAHAMAANYRRHFRQVSVRWSYRNGGAYVVRFRRPR